MVREQRVPECFGSGMAQKRKLGISALGVGNRVRYVSLTAIGTKRVNADWILPLGDIAVQMYVLNILPMSSSPTEEPSSSSSPIPAQPSILVLCKRALHCVTHGGNPRFTIRLQTVALCLTVLSHWKDAHIPLCIGTATKTVLFYSDTRLIWSGQLPFTPQQIGTCTFSESLRSMLALLSDEGNLFIGYLGTEPSLFRMPVTESRFIDFESRKKELREFEEIIWRSTKKSKEGDQQQQSIDVRVDIDQHSASFNAIDGVPSATLTISMPNLEEDNSGPTTTTNVPSTMCFKSELFCVQGNQWTTTLQKSVPFSATIFCHERPVLDPKCQICILSPNGIRFANFCVPLALICREVNAQRQANIKISLDSTKTALDLATVFPEFTQTKERNSLGFQPFFGEQRQNLTVSLFVSTKMNRYRIQSDSCDFLYAILSCLVERVHQLQPDVQLRCPIPMHLFLGEIAKFIEAENQFEQLEKEACRVSVQMRHVETVFLSATKCGDGEQQNNQLTSIGTLLNYTHRELANSLDKIANVQQMLNRGGRHSLRSLLNLMNALFKINGLNLPFDGSILDGTDQKLSERIAQLLSPADVQLVADLNSAEIGRLLAELLEKGDDSGGGGKLGGIAEEDEDEAAEEEENEENVKREEERDQRELQEAIAKSEHSLGLAELRSGSLPVKHHLD
ncbi:hypothetical protein niasHS_018207 [Heterodera schachtii]|uniref:Protein PTHB1 n=1 Tax=Heterodera schachtii TaxID=97005 RepID=A0ABD2HVH8_HETSC